MDSITQIVLGAAVGEVLLGKKIGRKAALYGAFFGTFPDLDVLWVKNAVDSFTEHRSFSHSLFVLLLVSPVFAWLMKQWHPLTIMKEDQSQDTNSFQYFVFSVYTMLATHPILDWFTVYGTQLLWPFNKFPFGLSSVYIVDPLYTLPFLICLLITIKTRKRTPVIVGLILSSSYLVWSLFAQSMQNEHFEADLKQKGIVAVGSMTLPMPLNTFLWKNIAMTEDGYWITFRSVFDPKNLPLKSQFFRSDSTLLPREQTHDVKKLQAFTKGFYQVVERDGQVWLSDLRMGGFGRFVFNFNVAFRNKGGEIEAHGEVQSKSIRPAQVDVGPVLSAVINRISKSNEDLFEFFDGAEMLDREEVD